MNIGKKLLSLLTVFCLTLSLVPTVALAATSDPTSVMLGSAQMVKGNDVTYYSNDSVVINEPTSWTAKYEPNSHTLTLNNYHGSSIYSTGNLTILLTGTNTITSSSNGIMIGREHYKNANLMISGTGKLILTSSDNGSTIYVSNNLTVQGGAMLEVSGGTSGQAIHAEGGKIIIQGQNTHVTAKNGTSLGVVRSGHTLSKYGGLGTVELNDGAKLTATRIDGTLIVNGKEGTLISGDNTAPSAYTVSGKVIDEANRPVANASVQLAPTDTANAGASAVISTSATTGNDGTYSFSNVPAGNYTITASKEGYSASTGASVNVTVNNADVTTGTDLTLSLIKYNVYVNGTQVTGINKDNVLNDSDQTVKYTPASEDGTTPQKLTLNGAKIVNGTNRGIKASDDLMIDLIGENTINATSNAIYLYHKTTEATSPKLTITSNQSGTLSMTSSNTSTTVYAYSDITINGSAKVNATINGTAQAIHSPNGKITIGGTAEVIATNEHSTTSTTDSIAVLVGTDSSPFGTIEVKDSASLKAQGHGKALGCTTFTYPANGYVAKGSTDYKPSNPGEYVAGKLAIYKYVEVKPKSATPTTFDVTLTNGTGYTLSATDSSSTPVTSGGSYSFTLNITDGYGKDDANFKVKANETVLTPDSNGVYKIEGITDNQNVTVDGVVKVYNVWVAGKQVTEANKNNVLSDRGSTRSVVYNPIDKKLTLSGAQIQNTANTNQAGTQQGNIETAGIMTTLDNLTIDVTGNSTIISTNGHAVAAKNLTITGTRSTLELNSQANMRAISLDYDLYSLAISGSVEITATATKNDAIKPSGQSDGMTITAHDITIQNSAKVTAINTGENLAIYCPGILTVNNSATLIAQSKENDHAITANGGFTYLGHFITASEDFAGSKPDETYNPEKLDPGVNKTGYRYVEVRPTSGTVITGIKLNKELSMKVGTTDTLTPVFTPANATEQTATWTSSDKTIATVTNGKVTAVGVGTATITVLTKDGGYTDTCTVTVSNPSSSSGSHTTYYPVNTPVKSEGGSVVVRQKSASKGSAVTVTVTPESGYQVSSVQAVDKDGKKLTLTDKGDGKYSFVMPGSKVEVSASFAQVQKPEETSPYRDVSKDSYYYDAVQWASNKGITNGVSDGVFAPDWVCTRGQIVTFLWRSVGSSAPKTAEMPFADVAEDAYYAQAVLWAVENGITKGTSETTFSPNETCTRAHAVAFLYRLAGSPAVTGSSFQDVAADAYYNAAVAWAVQQGITKGTSETTFSPNETCTRAQIVTFLYRMDQAK